jgi:hypothetical protein
MFIYFVEPGEGISWTGDVAASSTGGGEVLADFSTAFLRAFFLRWRQNSISESIAIRAARPPTTPPAIALTLVLLELPVLVGFDVPVGMVRVAALMLVKDGLRSKYTAKSLLSHVAGFDAVAPPVGLKHSQNTVLATYYDRI